MGKLIAVLIPVLTAWALLAKIFPDWFEMRKNHPVIKALFGPKGRWVVLVLLAVLASRYIWSVEDRLNKIDSGPVNSMASPSDETGLIFMAWGPTPDASGCTAAINASKLPATLKDRFDIALVCGFTNPTVDRMKDTRISVSTLFSPQDVVQVSLPFSKAMTEFISRDEQETIAKLSPAPVKGTPLGLQHVIWLKAVLLPKGTDKFNVEKLADVASIGGKIANTEASVALIRAVPAP